jgi:hypothetical protein
MTGKILFLILLTLTACVTEFVPEVTEEKELLVVEGLLTDQPETNVITLSKSLPLGKKSEARPFTGCIVRITDDLGNLHSLREIGGGRYITDSTVFRGQVGRTYTLHISTNTGFDNLTYESVPVRMLPVPPVDSLFYEKKVIREPFENFRGADGCQVYLSTHDPQNICKYYRWSYEETWKIQLNFSIPNKVCYISEKFNFIDIKTTTNYQESRIEKHPIAFVTNETDRLLNEYSIGVNQYSMTEDEYTYWEKLQNVTEETGGLYDIIPSSIPSNLKCNENPDEKVLGYFSVSAKSTKRIFIRDKFNGIFDPYAHCVTDTVDTANPPGLNESVWILIAHPCSFPCLTLYETTTDYNCTDCTLRGTTNKPDFWEDLP